MSDTQRTSSTGRIPAEIASALPMPLHHIRDGRAVCDAPEASICRLICAEACDAEQWPCGGDYDDDDAPKHDMTDSGECHVVLFMESGYNLWDYAEDDEGRGEDPPADGDIECEWTGDDYAWRYAETARKGSQDA